MVRYANPIIVALDEMEKEEVITTVRELGKKVWGYKLAGVVLKEGTRILDEIQKEVGLVNLFLDLQLSGTPEFIREAISIFSRPEVHFISCNAISGPVGIRTAFQTAHLTKILVGSTLSSLSIADIKFLFDTIHREIKAYEFARLVRETRAYGLYCAAEELDYLFHQSELNDITKVGVGIRPEWYPDKGYHTYTLTSKAVLERRATYFVIGDPITKAENKIEAVERILKDIEYI